jgi:hypothetical protein
MTGAQITDAEAARMNLRLVIPAAAPEGFWKQRPSIRKKVQRPLAGLLVLPGLIVP